MPTVAPLEDRLEALCGK
jgi:hypothetical protein